MSFGIKPVGIYADESVKTDPNLKDLDLTGIEILGEEWGKIDVEKAAALGPDLIVADWWPAEKAHSGLEEGVEEKSKKLAELAPSSASSQGNSIVDLAEGYEELAESLGADVDDPEIAADKTAFEAAVDAFKAAVAAKPGLTALGDVARRRHALRRQPGVRARAARLPALGPGRDQPGQARPGLPVLGEPQLGERRQVPARPAPVRRPLLRRRSTPRRAEAADLVQPSRRPRPARSSPGRRTGCTPTATTPTELDKLTDGDRDGRRERRRLTALIAELAPRHGPGALRRSAAGLARPGCVGPSSWSAFLSITLGSRDDRPGRRCCARLRGLGADGDDHDTVIREHARAAHAARPRSSARRSASAGALLQGVTRNPLADPGIMGINAGRGRRSSSSASPSSACSGIGVYVWFAFAGAGRRDRAGLRPRLARPRGRDPGEAGPGRRGGHRRAGVVTTGDPADRRRRAQRAPVLAGRLARRPLRADPGRRRAVPRRRPGRVARLRPRRSTAWRSARTSPAALGQRVGLHPGRGCSRSSRCSCGAATAACGPIVFVGLAVPHVARLHLRARLPLDPAVLVLLGADPAAAAPTSSAGSWSRPASCRSASCSACSARRSSSRWSATASWRSCDATDRGCPRRADRVDVRRPPARPPAPARLVVDRRAGRRRASRCSCSP